jgi:Cd2+/Zn2+-exporting ATPase
MDCSACALKIETALKRLPGLADINVNYATETLSLQVDEDRTSLAAVEGRIRSLGYVPIALDSTAAGPPRSRDGRDGRDQPWWRTRKGRMVLGLAALLAAAAVISTIKPAYSFWAYGLAAILGVVPVARRALAGTMSGTPFTIET